MLLDAGCRFVILGHSERRQKLGEDDAFINKKVHVALSSGLDVILCVGETLAEREARQLERVLQTQLDGSMAGLTAEQVGRLAVAYEPVWAIGTGRNATPEQAQEAHAFIRSHVAKLFSAAVADALVIQYGGSVKPENVVTLLRQPDVDGALVGGASLEADKFLTIVRAAL
jgi:triosephosphate isomerase